MCSGCSEIFSFIGNIFGWVIYFFYSIFKNYGVSIILFSIFTRILLFPLNIKQQKSTAAQSRLQPKLKQLQAQYGNDRDGYNRAVQELYTKEGVSPSAGCLPMLIQMPLLFGLYEAIRNPLSCVLHLPDKVITSLYQTFNIDVTTGYAEINIIRNIGETIKTASGNASGSASAAAIMEKLNGTIGPDYIKQIEECSNSFRFLGLDLLGTPSLNPINILIIFSILVFVTSVLSMQITNKINKVSNQSAGGCSPNVMTYGMAAMSTWFSFMVPAALALYWITGSCIAPVQSWIIKKYFGTQVLNAKAEAQRVAMIKQDEQKIIDEINAKKGKIIIKPEYPKDKFEGIGIQGGSNKNKKNKK